MEMRVAVYVAMYIPIHLRTITCCVVFIGILVTLSLADENQHTVQDCEPVFSDVTGNIEITCERADDTEPNTSEPREKHNLRSLNINAIMQRTEGFCSPAVAHVTGNVTIECKGVNPKVLKAMNNELAKTRQTIAEKIAAANHWMEKHHKLEVQMTEIQEVLTDDAKQRRISKLAFDALEDGDQVKAGHYLDLVLKKDNPVQAKIHSARGTIYQLKSDYPNALKHYEIASKLEPENLGYAFDVAYTHEMLEQRQESQVMYQKLIPAIKAKVTTEPSIYRPLLARALNNIGTSLLLERDYKNSKEYLQDSLLEYNMLSDTQYAEYAGESAGTHANLATVRLATGQPAEGLIEYRWAEGLARIGVRMHPELHSLRLAGILRNKGEIERYFGNQSNSEMALKESLKLFESLAAKEPLTYRAEVAATSERLASAYEEFNEFEKAFNALEKSGEIYQGLEHSKDISFVSFQGKSANVHKKLAQWSFFLKRDVPKAIKYGEIASSCYEILFKHSKDVRADYAETGAFLGEVYYFTHAYQQALSHYARSHKSYRTLHQESPSAYKDAFAALLNNYALLAFTGKVGHWAEGCKLVDEALALEPSDKIVVSLKNMGSVCKSSRPNAPK